MSKILKTGILLSILLIQFPLIISNIIPDVFATSNEDSSQTIGEQSVIVILVEFIDLQHKKSKKEISNEIFGNLNKYVTEISYNETWITGDITNWIELPYEISFYGRDFALGLDVESRRLFSDAIRAVDDSIDFKKYKHIMIVHAGSGQETSGELSDLWSAYYVCRPPVYADGLILTNVIIVPEDQAEGKNPLGVYAHEFMHSLGLPDLYPAKGLKKKHLDMYDVMDGGFKNGKSPGGNSPSHPSAWSKLQLGWLVKTTMIYPGSMTNVTIWPLEDETDKIQAVILPSTNGIYYLLEVRQKSGFDKYLPDSGVLITLVNEKLPPQSGMVRIIDSDPSTLDLTDAAFKVGETYQDSAKLIKISIISGSNGFTILVDRRHSQDTS
ncbi:M6 family metalloprotease domain-containing protein [[Eubacterium] cellulosolvens]